MEKMYQEYKDVAEFRMIYIREAHAMDSNRPTRTAQQKGIKNHTNYEERCTTAQMLQEDGSLTMPMLIDGMDNLANEDYSAHPDRVFLVRTDGRLAVAASRGPRGFGPGLDEVADWLADFKESGEEGELSPEAIEKADRATESRQAKSDKATLAQISKIAGDWNVNNVADGEEFTSTVTLSAGETSAAGLAKVGDMEIQLERIRFDGKYLSFSFTTENDTTGRFSGELTDDGITGELSQVDSPESLENSTFKSTWIKAD